MTRKQKLSLLTITTTALVAAPAFFKLIEALNTLSALAN